jgi:hypothetical protein
VNIDTSTRISLEVAGAASLLALLAYLMFSWLYEKATGKDERTPSYRPFSNVVTLSILLLCLVLIIGGVIVIFRLHSFYGVPMGILGAFLWYVGDTDIPSKPRYAGMLMWYDTPIRIGDKPIVLGGRTILLRFWPFCLTVRLFKMTTVEESIEAIIYAKDDTGKSIPLYGKIAVAVRPRKDGLLEFNQAGGMDNIMPQIKLIVIRETRHLAQSLTPEKIVTDPTIFADLFVEGGQIRESVQNAMDLKSFGAELTNLQPDFDYSEDLRKTMEGHQKELFERQNEQAEYDTDVLAAQNLLQKHRGQKEFGISFNDCLEQVKQMRLIRDGKTFNITSSGGVGTVNVAQLHVNADVQGSGKQRGK